MHLTVYLPHTLGYSDPFFVFHPQMYKYKLNNPPPQSGGSIGKLVEQLKGKNSTLLLFVV
jgi:hypothetical protein